MYNITQLTEAENIQDMIVYANSSTYPVSVMGVIMLGIFFILLIVFLKNGIERSILTSGFICFVLSSLLAWGGMVGMVYPFAFLAIIAFTYLYLVITNN